MSAKKQKVSVGHRVLTIIGIVLCVILIPMLIINCTLIVKNVVNPDKVPTMFGTAPMIVQSGSMQPTIRTGDLIFSKVTEPEDVKEGDIISFYDPDSNGKTVNTHRVIKIETVVEGDKEQLQFRTKGDFKLNKEDKTPVPAENLIGVYQFRIAGAGNVAMFMQSTLGFVICVILPIALFVLYDFIRRKLYEKENAEDTEALKAELEALKAEKAAALTAQNEETPAE